MVGALGTPTPRTWPSWWPCGRRLDAAIALAVKGQRRNGFSWAAIGRGLGITRQAAQMAWGRVVEELEHAEMLELLAEHRERLGIRPVYGSAVNGQDDAGALPAVVGR